MRTYMVTIGSETHKEIEGVTFTMKSESSREFLKAVLKRDLSKRCFCVQSVYVVQKTNNKLGMKDAIEILNGRIELAEKEKLSKDANYIRIKGIFDDLRKNSKLSYVEVGKMDNKRYDLYDLCRKVLRGTEESTRISYVE